MAQTVKNLPAMQENWVRSLSWDDPLEEGWQPTSVFLPGKSHRQRRMAGSSLLGCRRVGHDLATEQQLKVLVLELSVQVMLLLNVRVKFELRFSSV